MKKTIVGILAGALLVPSFASAQTPQQVALLQQIQVLIAQLNSLKAQIAAMKQSEVASEKTEVNEQKVSTAAAKQTKVFDKWLANEDNKWADFYEDVEKYEKNEEFTEADDATEFYQFYVIDVIDDFNERLFSQVERSNKLMKSSRQTTESDLIDYDDYELDYPKVTFRYEEKDTITFECKHHGDVLGAKCVEER